MSSFRIASFLFGFALSATLASNGLAQETNRYAVTFSYGPKSPEVPATYSAADICCVNSTKTATAPVLWTEADFGVAATMPALPNIDAASDGEDVLPKPTAGCRQIWIEYTVTPNSQGRAGSIVESRSKTSTLDPGGPANDVFGKAYHQDLKTGFYLETEYLVSLENGVSPNSKIDALLWTEVREGDVYFSIDKTSTSTASTSPADILIWEGATGVVTKWAGYNDLGLTGTDNIDALAIDLDRQLVVFSLAIGSPSLGSTYVPGTTIDGATLIGISYTEDSFGVKTFSVSGALEFKSAAELELQTSDDLTGVRVADPGEFPTCNSTQGEMGKPWAYDQIKINGTAGNVPRVVSIPLQSGPPATFDIDLKGSMEYLVLFWTVGRPCTSQALEFTAAGGWLAFPPILPPLVFGVLGGAPVSILIPPTLPAITVTFQGAIQGPMSGLNTTNLITLQKG